VSGPLVRKTVPTPPSHPVACCVSRPFSSVTSALTPAEGILRFRGNQLFRSLRVHPLESTYFKRFRMEVDLIRERRWLAPRLPSGFEFVPWNEALLDVHARTKFSAFRAEIDAVVFPCLGRLEGCRRLMREIRRKPGFLPEATWLVARRLPARSQAAARFTPLEWCGTIQGVIDRAGLGSIQNVGILPAARGLGLGSSLIGEALAGFRDAGVRRATLEVTAENTAAIRLYHRLGFRRIKTIYKSVEQVRREQQRQQPTVERLPLGVPAGQLKPAASRPTGAAARSKRGVVSTMVSAVISGLVVAEEAADVADSGTVASQLATMPAGSEPLATSRTS